MDVSCLKPGYVHQGFSLSRTALAKASIGAKNYNNKAGYLAEIPIYLASKASEYIEVPFKTIEDVALTIINGVGALFGSEGCKLNNREWKELLSDDVVNSFLTVAACYLYTFFATIEGFNALAQGTAQPLIFDYVSPEVRMEKNLSAFAKIKDARSLSRIY